MKLGFFGGSFNPPSNVHINLANSLIQDKIVDRVVFVPVGDYYKKDSLVEAKHRYNMLKYAIEDNENLDVEAIAIEADKKLFAIDTFKLIKDKYKNDNIFFVMGSDNFRKMPKWKDFKQLIEEYNIIVIERERKKLRNNNKTNIIEVIPKKIEKIDSSKIRKMIANNEDVSLYIKEKELKYIYENKLYKI